MDKYEEPKGGMPEPLLSEVGACINEIIHTNRVVVFSKTTSEDSSLVKEILRDNDVEEARIFELDEMNYGI
jgi:hypothetical protein